MAWCVVMHGMGATFLRRSCDAPSTISVFTLQVLKAAAMAEQPMKQFYKLPPSTQRSEGFVYDITSSTTIKNAELNAKREAKAQR